MTRTLKAWREIVEEGDYKIADVVRILDDADETISTLNTSANLAAGKDADVISELEDKLAEAQGGPEWGNCKRGCSPAYLNKDGFCSPACRLGAPRGEFVTPWPSKSIAAVA